MVIYWIVASFNWNALTYLINIWARQNIFNGYHLAVNINNKCKFRGNPYIFTRSVANTDRQIYLAESYQQIEKIRNPKRCDLIQQFSIEFCMLSSKAHGNYGNEKKL